MPKKKKAPLRAKPPAATHTPKTAAPLVAAEWLPADALERWAKNPRKNERAIPAVKNSIERFGFVAPICVWTSRGRLVAGHTRLTAFEELTREKGPAWAPKGAPGPGLVPVRSHEFASEAEATAYALADNRLAELSEWDEPARDELLREIAPDRELFDATGFDFDARFLEDETPPPGDPDGAGKDPDEAPAPRKEPRTKPGDLWLLGKHRLICGDSRKSETLARLCNGQKMDLLWTDPPYNVGYVGKTKESLTIQNDSMGDGDFAAFLAAFLAAADAAMRPGAVFYIAHADTEGLNFRGAVKGTGWKLAQCLIWAKDRFVMGRQDYHWRHEPILYGWKEGAGHHMVADRCQDTLWQYARPARSEEHPTMKPVELVERAIANSTDHGDRVLDCFGGSGTTLIACERRERIAHLVEIDPVYCDVIVDRFESYTGRKATLEVDGDDGIASVLASGRKLRAS